MIGVLLGASISAQIAALFASGEQGALYELIDGSTLTQDNVGLLPVTATGQSVGLSLDKRFGLVRGPELVVNSDNEVALYSGPLGSASGINAAVVRAAAPGGGFAASVSPTGGNVPHHALLLLQANKAYEITARVYVPTGSIATARLFDANDGSWAGSASTAKDQWVTLSGIRPAGKASNWFVGVGDNVSANIDGQAFYIDNLSVRELPGNHRVQPTLAARPLYQAAPSRLVYDAADDVLTTIFTASLGNACTVVRSIPGIGASILTGQTIGTSYADTVTNSGLLIISRALTTNETGLATRWANQRAGV